MYYFLFYAHNQIADNLCDDLTSIKDQLKSTPKKDIPNLVEKALDLTCQIYLFYINEMYGANPIKYISKKELLSKKSLECLRQWESSKKQNVKILEPVFMEIAEILRKDELQRSDKEHAEKFAITVEWIYLNAIHFLNDSMTPSNHKHVFISYSSKEKDIARETKKILETNDIKCWMAPDSIENTYTKDIPIAIGNSSAVVLLLSKASQESKWVPSEIENAVSKNVPVIPFHIDKSPLNEEFNFMLSRSQRIQAYERLSDAYEELISRIKKLTSQKNS